MVGIALSILGRESRCMGKWIRSLAFLSVVAAVSHGSTAEAGSCSDVDRLVAEASVNFPKDASVEPTGAITAGGTCDLSLQLDGSRVYRCYWKHAYRDADALAAFETKDRMLQTCTASKARAPQDQQVNHPDSYDLRTYQAGNVRLTASIKDKAALQETYVFLAIYGVTPD